MAGHLPLLSVLLFFLCLLFVAQIVSPLQVYDRLTLINICESFEKLPICGLDGHSKTPMPLLASIPLHLRHFSCWLPRNSRRRRRGKQGGILIKVKHSSFHDPRRLSAGSITDYSGYDLWSSTYYSYRWLRPVIRDTGVLLQCCRPVRISQRGCAPGNLRPLSRFSHLSGRCSVHMALLTTRSLTNKTFIFNDFFTTRDLDFLLTETWLKPGEISAFSEFLPPSCSFFSTPRAAGHGGGLAAIFKESFRCKIITANNYSSFGLQLFVIDLSCPVLCATIYRPPNFNKNFLQVLSEFFV